MDLEKVKSFLSLNGFKLNMIDKYIKSFLNKINNPPKPPITIVNKQILYVKLQYHGEESIKALRNLYRLFAKFYPQIKLNISFQTGFRIKKAFSSSKTLSLFL